MSREITNKCNIFFLAIRFENGTQEACSGRRAASLAAPGGASQAARSERFFGM